MGSLWWHIRTRAARLTKGQTSKLCLVIYARHVCLLCHCSAAVRVAYIWTELHAEALQLTNDTTLDCHSATHTFFFVFTNSTTISRSAHTHMLCMTLQLIAYFLIKINLQSKHWTAENRIYEQMRATTYEPLSFSCAEDTTLFSSSTFWAKVLWPLRLEHISISFDLSVSLSQFEKCQRPTNRIKN